MRAFKVLIFKKVGALLTQKVLGTADADYFSSINFQSSLPLHMLLQTGGLFAHIHSSDKSLH